MGASQAGGEFWQDIAVCAYCIWEQEGRPEGRAIKHWLQAEIQLAASKQHEEAASGKTKGKGCKGAKALVDL